MLFFNWTIVLDSTEIVETRILHGAMNAIDAKLHVLRVPAVEAAAVCL